MFGNSHPRVLAADSGGIAEAARVLRSGGLVAVPTETVYGLAARADSEEAVAAIYRAKGRPDFNPLIVHVRNFAAASEFAHFGDAALHLASHFWPGPLTLVLPKVSGARLAPAVTAGLATLAVRCPAHPAMQALLAEAGLPLAAPSANRSGAVSPTSAAHVAASLGDRVDLILDGGRCVAGIESTIAALRADGSWHLLRPGPIAEDAIARMIGPASAPVTPAASIEAPGQLEQHYSPGKPVRLDAEHPDADEFHIGFGSVTGHLNLSPGGDLTEAAASLYAALHAGASAAQSKIAVAPIPQNGVGAAIRDRLRRAAA